MSQDPIPSLSGLFSESAEQGFVKRLATWAAGQGRSGIVAAR